MHPFKIAASMLFLTPICVANAGEVAFAEIETYDRSDYNRETTLCDKLAAHPGDPEKVGDGVSQNAMDKPAAIAACLDAISDDPENPRLNYQLARAYGYSGRHADGDPYRDAAVRKGYPQSLFVVGYIRLEGWDGREKDPCYGGELIRRSAHAGRFAGLVGFPHYALNGRFDECDEHPRINEAELAEFLETAETRAGDFYQRLLVSELTTRLDAENRN